MNGLPGEHGLTQLALARDAGHAHRRRGGSGFMFGWAAAPLMRLVNAACRGSSDDCPGGHRPRQS
jgi:hypothetical protein